MFRGEDNKLSKTLSLTMWILLGQWRRRLRNLRDIWENSINQVIVMAEKDEGENVLKSEKVSETWAR